MGRGIALPLNLNAKNLSNADFFLVKENIHKFKIPSVSELQPKTSDKKSAVLKEEEN